ncbi:MAG: hypothetical protein ACREJL_04130 [Candidatus Methylomirabilales bacterium]
MPEPSRGEVWLVNVKAKSFINARTSAQWPRRDYPGGGERFQGAPWRLWRIGFGSSSDCERNRPFILPEVYQAARSDLEALRPQGFTALRQLLYAGATGYVLELLRKGWVSLSNYTVPLEARIR